MRTFSVSSRSIVVSPQALSVTITTPTTPVTSDDDELAIVVPPTPTQLLPLSETDGLTAGAVQAPGSTGKEHRQQHEVRVSISDSGTDSERSSVDDEPAVEEWEDDEQRLIRQGGNGIPVGPVRNSFLFPFSYMPPQFPSVCAYSATDAPYRMQDGTPRPLLPAISSRYLGRKCLVLDLDETLVHSSLRVSFDAVMILCLYAGIY